MEQCRVPIEGPAEISNRKASRAARLLPEVLRPKPGPLETPHSVPGLPQAPGHGCSLGAISGVRSRLFALKCLHWLSTDLKSRQSIVIILTSPFKIVFNPFFQTYLLPHLLRILNSGQAGRPAAT